MIGIAENREVARGIVDRGQISAIATVDVIAATAEMEYVASGTGCDRGAASTTKYR